MADLVMAYKARPEMVGCHNRTQFRAVVVCHRRFGKTVWAINDLVAKALRKSAAGRMNKPRYAYVCPELKQAKDNGWEYLKAAVEDIPGIRISHSELSVTFPGNGARIRIYGADNPESLRGGWLDGVVLDEYGDMRPEVYTSVVGPMLHDHKGWIVFMGTPKGKNQFYDMREIARTDKTGKWFYACVKASQSGIFSQEELDEERRIMGDDNYRREYECDFDAAVPGTYYATQMGPLEATNLIDLPIEPGHPVRLNFDMGYTDTFAIGVIQHIKGEIRFVDYHETSNQKLDDVMDEIFAMRDSNGAPYKIEHIYMPHDAKAKDLHTGMTDVEYLAKYRIPISIVSDQHVRDGIGAVRRSLHAMYFDKTRCYKLWDHLKSYRRKYDKARGVYAEEPIHDKASHGADMVRYTALTYTDQVRKEARAVSPTPPTPTQVYEQYQAARRVNTEPPAGITLDQLFARHERRRPVRRRI